MSPHLIFVTWAYGIAAVALSALVAATWRDLRRQHRLLGALEASGARRRRPAEPGPVAPQKNTSNNEAKQ